MAREPVVLLAPGVWRVPLFGDLFVNEPLPKDGWIDIPDTPGWGVELNRKGLKLKRPYEH